MPGPLAPLLIVIQPTLLIAVHEQLVPVVPDTVLLPMEGKETLIGVTV